jgi:hypothetical protein
MPLLSTPSDTRSLTSVLLAENACDENPVLARVDFREHHRRVSGSGQFHPSGPSPVSRARKRDLVGVSLLVGVQLLANFQGEGLQPFQGLPQLFGLRTAVQGPVLNPAASLSVASEAHRTMRRIASRIEVASSRISSRSDSILFSLVGCAHGHCLLGAEG